MVIQSFVQLHGGIWFYPNSKQVSLIGIQSIRELRLRQRPPKSSRVFWVFEYGNSDYKVQDFGDLFACNREKVADYLRAHGIDVDLNNLIPTKAEGREPSRGARPNW